MEMKGRHSTIRSWRSADVTSLVKHANNANVARQLRDRFPHPYTAADARRFIEAIVAVRPVMTFAIDVDGEAVGGIGFSPGSDVERYSAEIGYWLGEAFWGRGIGTEAVRIVSDYAFETCNVLRLFALPFADNMRSTRVLEKAGYRREAVLRSSSVKGGVPRDQALYALINPSWRGE
jgi:ribosomal-protein-alanine N-acetyltransferase